MRKLFNDEWKFLKTDCETTIMQAVQMETDFLPVDLPHDWLIYNTRDLYENSFGWYMRNFCVEDKAGRYLIYFEGVYMDSTFYVNGQKAGDWKYGYSSFEFDITDYLREGDNQLLMQVRHQAPNSRWYSGAGIYRNVWMRKVPSNYLTTDGIYAVTRPCQGRENCWKLDLSAELTWNQEDPNSVYKAKATLFRDGKEISIEGEKELKLHFPEEKAVFSLFVQEPKLWDIETPNVYRLKVELTDVSGKTLDCVETSLGFKTVDFVPEKGFFLNGRHVRLNGVCEHHDLGALGAAYHSKAMRRKMETLKRMGCNAIRTSHNMPAPDFMDLADEMGFLVVSEGFDMWEKSKTEFDYARFFKEWMPKDVASWVRRDRNHPSLLMWSIGNEIYDTHADEHGQEITVDLKSQVEKHDPMKNGVVTIGSNYMPWENAQKCADIVKMAGYNYAEIYYHKHHEQHPDWVIYGSETSSVVQSRGIYHFPFEQLILTDDDEQCSALGNSTTSWGAKSPEYCIYADRDAEFSMGQFIWTGHDYIGEPTPYQTKNSYFGQIDTAGFPKDSFYFYQAEWTDGKKMPMVHIFPYWDFNEGQMIDVRACSNCPKVELFLNGKSLGVTDIDHAHGTELMAHVKVPFEKGQIEAVAYDEEGNAVAKDVQHSFGEPSRICLTPSKTTLWADGEDLLFVEISMEDKDGHAVANAADYVKVDVKGAGRLLGLDNGDSTDYDPYKGTVRKLFSGKLLAIVGTTDQEGEIQVDVEALNAPHIAPAKMSVSAKESCKRSGVSCNSRNMPMELVTGKGMPRPVRKLQIESSCGQTFTPDCKEMKLKAQILPIDATDQKVQWSVVNSAGIPTNLAQIAVDEKDGRWVTVKALGDGEFYVRCTTGNGTEKVRLISQLEFSAEGLGCAFLNPYEFVVAGLYQKSKGEVSGYNERGIGTAREGETWIGYSNLDFGDFGSDEITLPIFAMNDEAYDLWIWDGMPDEEGSSLLVKVVYQKPCLWDVYQEVTYKLNKRLKGVHTLCFATKDQKYFIKGFSFRKYEKAYEKLAALEANRIYGDTYSLTETAVEGIGNNVSLEYEGMDFGVEGVDRITICGKTTLEKNTIHIRFFDEEGQSVNQLVEFPMQEEYTELSFDLDRVMGKQKVVFVFLPGCDFDFKAFRFDRKK